MNVDLYVNVCICVYIYIYIYACACMYTIVSKRFVIDIFFYD